jgi:multiple sugar transport system substrate-binding protein
MTQEISRRVLFGGLAAGLTLPLLAACAATGGSTAASPSPTKLGPATIRFSSYGNDQKLAMRSQLATVFMKTHPKTTMVFEGSPTDSYWAKLATQIAGGNAPDVINIDTVHMGQYGSKGALSSLQPYIPSFIETKYFDENLLALGQVGGKQFGVPVAATSFGWAYSTTILDEIGVKAPDGTTWTWDTFATLCNQIRRKSKNKYYGSADPSGDNLTLQMWVRSHGSQYYKSDTKLGFSEDMLGDWFDYWAKLRKSGGIVPADQTAEQVPGDWAKGALVNRLAAMSNSNTSIFDGAFQALTKDNLEITLPPKGTASGKNPTFPSASSYLSLNAKCKAPDQAAEFINWFVNSKEAAETLRLISGPPASSAGAKAILGSSDLTPIEKKVVAYSELTSKYSSPAPSSAAPAADANVTTLLLKASQDIAFGRQSVSAGVKQFMSAANSALATGAIS